MSDKQLKKLQLNILEILKYIDEFCKKNDIQYYAVYGTCIGAIRHKGFIPWDDDIDIAMTKENYDKFCQLFSKSDTGKYFLQTKETDKEYDLDFAKIRDTSVTLIQQGTQDKNMVFGTYVDIFPLTGVPDNKILKKIQKINRAFYLSTDKKIIKNGFFQKVFEIVCKIFGKENIKKYCYNQMMKYDCGSSQYWMSGFASLYEENIHPSYYYGEPLYVDFEDTKIPVPQEYDKYLRKIYGDYMVPPNKEQRKKDQHSVYILDLEKPYTYYKKNPK